MSARIEASGIVLSYGTRRVLDGVDLAVGAGELVALVGPNGAGKSTLLHVLAGDATPEHGTVLLDGLPLGGYRPLELARLRSVLTQHNEVSFAFTAAEVIEMGRSPWRGHDDEEQDDARIDSGVAAAEVGHLLERRMPELSGGERARVAYARVRAQAADIMLLDEPTASLDVRHQEAVLAGLADHARAGGTAIVVLHDLDLAAAYADRIVVIDGGVVRADGPPAAALDPDLLSAVYRHPISVEHRDGELVVRPDRTRIRKDAHA